MSKLTADSKVGSEVKSAEVRPASGLISFAKSRLPKSIADNITTEKQVESYRSQWEKEGSPQEQPQHWPKLHLSCRRAWTISVSPVTQ